MDSFLDVVWMLRKKIEYKPAASNIKNLGPTVYMVLLSRVRKMM